MKLEGSYKLNVKKEDAWKALNDPNINWVNSPSNFDNCGWAVITLF